MYITLFLAIAIITQVRCFSNIPKVYIIHDNSKWLVPLVESLKSASILYDDEMFDLSKGTSVDLTKAPPAGIFFNRPSPSAHTRGCSSTLELSLLVVNWLKLYKKRVINSSMSLSLSISKHYTTLLLDSKDISTPRSIFVGGRSKLISFLTGFQPWNDRFLLKHNRGGSGSGVHIFSSVSTAIDYVKSASFDDPVDDITILSDYIESPNKCMFRLEFVGCKLLYVVRVATSDLEVNNCPADACNNPLQGRSAKFRILTEVPAPVLALAVKLEDFGYANELEIYAVEVIVDSTGDAQVIDFNACNTNYNTQAEKNANISFGGYDVVANYLFTELTKV